MSQLTRSTLELIHNLLMQASVAVSSPDFEQNATRLVKAKKEVEDALGKTPTKTKHNRSGPGRHGHKPTYK